MAGVDVEVVETRLLKKVEPGPFDQSLVTADSENIGHYHGHNFYSGVNGSLDGYCGDSSSGFSFGDAGGGMAGAVVVGVGVAEVVGTRLLTESRA